ncbi:hypothetical protein HJ01_00362 [Flavobacterium frigoris PS1]|uniref:Uncharacterized protein n=1 Tax=Flavobacterium frigoris (strain PS1) TaxID=1086011 RepID=H7FMQ5_FLAFP|nr:hypothetical protein HJ01_00362 [Flavobacterium frigoris PS1]
MKIKSPYLALMKTTYFTFILSKAKDIAHSRSHTETILTDLLQKKNKKKG